MIFHDYFGRHKPDPSRNRLDNGMLISTCATCGKGMVKPAAQPWRLVKTRWSHK